MMQLKTADIEKNAKAREGKMANRPTKKWRSGSVEAAIWNNEREINGNIVGFKTISLSRSFKKKDENIWRSEQLNLRRNDIPKILLVLQKAQEELLLNQEDKGEGDDNE